VCCAGNHSDWPKICLLPGGRTIAAFKFVKWLDEGVSEPFFARLFMGLMELRDAALRSKVGPADLDRVRMRFDEKFEPVLEALMAARNAMKGIDAVMGTHKERFASGAIVQFQLHALIVKEGIDAPLRHHTGTFLSRVVAGLKGTQHVTSELGLDIGPFFASKKNYAKWLLGLRGNNPLLAEYVDAARSGWSESLTARRGALEHRGWMLDRVDHAIDSSVTPPRVQIVEPQIDGFPVTEYAERMGARVFAFTENVVAYACKCAIKPPLTVMEIDPTSRDPHAPKRFALGIPGVGPFGTAEWILRYSDPGFP
jgi:hypothetical protein